MNEHSVQELGLAQVLRNLATELRDMGGGIQVVEDAIFDWARSVAPDADRPAALHELDMLMQVTGELSDFLMRLTDLPATPRPEEVRQSLDEVRLARLRERLGKCPSLPRQTTDGTDPNHVEFF